MEVADEKVLYSHLVRMQIGHKFGNLVLMGQTLTVKFQ
jgi:hypothetical protein